MLNVSAATAAPAPSGRAGEPASTAPPAPPAPPARPWPRLREELKLHEAGRNRDGSPAWHIADPVRNQFFRIGWLEVEMLRRWSLGDAARIAESIAETTTLSPDADDVQRFAHFLAQSKLLREGAAPRAPRAAWRWLLDNYLFIRIPLVRPQRALEAALPWVSWLFSRGFLALTVGAALLGLVLAARQWDRVEAAFAGALSWDGLLGFGVALVASKLIHELGHAFVSVRHGVRVGHMGVALLVMWPMPYTDTGESWKLARARERFAIASAGVASELVLAAWCTLAWNFAPEGNFKNALFFLASTAWLLTLAVNASPFMRFDGYFMLSDALDFPGLHERAGRFARRFVRHALLGLEEPMPESVDAPMRRLLIGFALVTWVYRLVLFVGIAVVVYHAFFKALGVLLFFVEMGVFVVRPMVRELAHWWARRAEAKRSRAIGLGALLVVLLAVVLVPWSSRVRASGVLHAGWEQPLYAPFPARLVSLPAGNGQAIAQGALVAELDEPVQASERDKARALASAYARTARGALGNETDGAARQAVAEQFESRYQAEGLARDAELARLKLTAPRAGVLRDLDPTLAAGDWVGTATPIAWLVDATRWRVEALVTEKDAGRLASGRRARVALRASTGAPLEGRVVSVDDAPVKKLPHLLLAQPGGGPIPLAPGAPPRELKPAETLYRVVVEGEGAMPDGLGAAAAVRAVTVHFEGERTSLAAQWFAAGMSVLIQQADL